MSAATYERKLIRVLARTLVVLATLAVLAVIAFVMLVGIAVDNLFSESSAPKSALYRLEVTPRSAALSARVDGEGPDSIAFVQYGTTKKYGSCSPPAIVAPDAHAFPVTLVMPKARPRRVYHYRLVIEAGRGEIFGATDDRTFTTPATGRIVVDPSQSQATEADFYAPMNCPT